MDCVCHDNDNMKISQIMIYTKYSVLFGHYFAFTKLRRRIIRGYKIGGDVLYKFYDNIIDPRII